MEHRYYATAIARTSSAHNETLYTDTVDEAYTAARSVTNPLFEAVEIGVTQDDPTGLINHIEIETLPVRAQTDSEVA